MDAPSAPQVDCPSVEASPDSPPSVTSDDAAPLVTSAVSESEAETIAGGPVIESISVIHATRTWVQYGIFGFAVLCIIIGAMEALFGR